jgi:hypothetical protein
MPLWLVEIRRTVEWGGYFQADTEEEAKQLAGLEATFDGADVIDEQVACHVVEAESK